MSRFTLHREAVLDLDGIIDDLGAIPAVPALKIGTALQVMLRQIAEWPLLGAEYTNFQRKHGFAVRSRLCGNYRIFYRTDLPIVDIIAIVHTKRDIAAIMRARLS